MSNSDHLDARVGLYRKYENITRTDGQSAKGEKHDGCEYFVLDLTHDPYALPALRAYQAACSKSHPPLARDLRLRIKAIELAAKGQKEAVTK